MSRNEPEITPELVAAHGLKPDAYERFLALIDIPRCVGGVVARIGGCGNCFGMPTAVARPVSTRAGRLGDLPPPLVTRYASVQAWRSKWPNLRNE